MSDENVKSLADYTLKSTKDGQELFKALNRWVVVYCRENNPTAHAVIIAALDLLCVCCNALDMEKQDVLDSVDIAFTGCTGGNAVERLKELCHANEALEHLAAQTRGARNND